MTMFWVNLLFAIVLWRVLKADYKSRLTPGKRSERPWWKDE
jgi:hypothetical protein